jgi:hypothetical protein
MLSQGPQVADMECPGIDRLMMSIYTDGDPLHHHIASIHHDGIRHINMFLEDNGFYSMRFK